MGQIKLDTDIVGVPIKLNRSPGTKKSFERKSIEPKKPQKKEPIVDVESARSKVKSFKEEVR